MTTPPGSESDVRPVRWGILGTGKIARTFAADLALVPDAELVAVGSRTASSAEAFMAEVPAATGARAHGSYEQLVADDAVDVVYVSSPHSEHLAHARLAMGAGRHVLCEKPLTLTPADSAAMIDDARAAGVFLMEAMWTACHPVVRALAEALRGGEFGRVRHLHAELGFVAPDDPSSRLLDPALGASTLLDMGIYPLTLAHLMLGEALSLTGSAVLGDGGVDLDVAFSGRYPGPDGTGAVATMAGSMRSWSSRRAALATDAGRIDVTDFHHPTSVTFTPHSDDGPGEPRPVLLDAHDAVIGRGYGNQIVEVHRCLRAALSETPLWPHETTLLLARQLADLRTAVGA